MKTRLLLVVAALLAWAAQAGATVLVAVEVEDLARSSHVVVRGRAGATRSAFTGDRRQIRSFTPVTVLQTLKGQAGNSVEVVTLGGTVGDISQVTSGSPRFREGEEVVLFLVRSGDRFLVDGFSQGKFQVTTGPDGVRRVARELSGVGMLGADGIVRPAARFEPVEEQAFVARIRRALAGQVAP